MSGRTRGYNQLRESDRDDVKEVLSVVQGQRLVPGIYDEELFDTPSRCKARTEDDELDFDPEEKESGFEY